MNTETNPFEGAPLLPLPTVGTEKVSENFALLDVRGRIAELSACLEKQDPRLPGHLAAIHKALLENEELVHLLSPEERRNLIVGQKRHVGIERIKAIVEKKGPGRAKKATAADF